MKDTINITIRIADAEPLTLPNVPRTQEESLRKVEKLINDLWIDWRARYSKTSSHQLLAMVTFRLAQLYYRQSLQIDETTTLLTDFEAGLDAILLDMGNDSSDNK